MRTHEIVIDGLAGVWTETAIPTNSGRRVEEDSRHINDAGLAIIKVFEGFSPLAYYDPVGVPTIGYGHTRTVKKSDVTHGRKITMEDGEGLLFLDLASAEAAVMKYIEVPLTPNQFSALVSFTFNLGGGALKRSTLRRKLNGGDYSSVPAELNRWVYAKKKKLRGLVRRRKAEGVLFKK